MLMLDISGILEIVFGRFKGILAHGVVDLGL